jgi:hypothetical protein
MIAKIRKHGAVPTLDSRQSLSVSGPPMHWCKHVKETRSPAAFELRVEARKIRNEAFGINEAPRDPETGRVVEDVPAQASNRRKAVAHTKAQNGNIDPQKRLEEIAAERLALLKEIDDAQSGINTTVATLVSEHGVDAIKVALKAAS